MIINSKSSIQSSDKKIILLVFSFSTNKIFIQKRVQHMKNIKKTKNAQKRSDK